MAELAAVSPGHEVELTFDSNEGDIAEACDTLATCQVLRFTNSFLSSFRDLGTQLQNLQVLSVIRTGLTDCDGIAALPQLRELYAGFNSIADVTGITLLEYLEVLDLEGNCLPLSSVGHLTSVSTLRSLNLASTPASNCEEYRPTVLHHLPFLNYLDDLEVQPAELHAAKQHHGSLRADASTRGPSSAGSGGAAGGDALSTVSATSEDSVVADAVRASVSTALLHPASPQALRLRAVASADAQMDRTLGIAVQHVLRPASADSPMRSSRRDAFGALLSARSDAAGGGDAFALRQHAEAAGGGLGGGYRRHSHTGEAQRPRTAGSLPSSTLAARWEAFCAQAAAGQEGGAGGLSAEQARSLQAQLDAVLQSSASASGTHTPNSASQSTASELTHGTSSALVGNAARALRRKGVVDGPAPPPSDPDAALDMAMQRLRRRSTAPSGSAAPAASARRSRADMLRMAGVAHDEAGGGSGAEAPPQRPDTSTAAQPPRHGDRPGLVALFDGAGGAGGGSSRAGGGGGFLAMLDAAKDEDKKARRSNVQLLSARQRASSMTSGSMSGRSTPSDSVAGAETGDAVSQSDEKLITLLSQRPKHVPQLKSRDAFRAYFRGIPRLRMERLLRLAFGSLESQARDEKVAKRMALLQGVFQEDS